MFDLDGTLIDSVPLLTTIINGMLVERGAAFRVTEAQTRPHATAGGHSMIAALLREHCGDVAEALADFRARYASLPTPADSLYPGVRAAIALLRDEGVAIAVWSNKAQHLCDKIFADLGMTDMLAAVVGTSDEVPLKPDVTGLDRALAAAGSARGACCFVGDSDLDHESARRAGVPFVMVTHGYGDYTRPWAGATMVDGFAAVPGVVRALLNLPALA